MRPTRACWLPLSAALVLHLLVRATGNSWLALGSAACLVLPVAALLLPARLGDLEIARRCPPRAAAGQGVEVVHIICNAGLRPSPPLHWTDRVDGLSPVVLAVPALAPGATASFTEHRTAQRRGVYGGASAQLNSAAPYGLVRVRREVAGVARLIVHPAAVPARKLDPVGSVGGATHSRPLAGAGTEVLGLRPWRPGDSARSVSPRATARHGRPVVLERERDSGRSLIVLTGAGGAGPAWEAGVAQAAALAVAATRAGSTPVLLGGPTATGLGVTGVLDWFAGVDAAGPLLASELLAAARAAGPGGTVLLLTADRGQARRLPGVRVEVLGA